MNKFENNEGMSRFDPEMFTGDRKTKRVNEIQCDSCGSPVAWYPSITNRHALFCSSECGDLKDYSLKEADNAE
jgi:hypothetical protein